MAEVPTVQNLALMSDREDGTMTDKKLKDFSLKQTPLFFTPGIKPSEPEKKSSSIELYDAIPKYFWGKASEKLEKTDPIERPFKFRGKMFVATIFPAQVKDSSGRYIDKLPGEREEIIEDALRKMASSNEHGCFLDEYAGVTFSLYQLRTELKRMGHTYSYYEIIESMQICSRTRMKLETADGKSIMESSIFETIGIQTKEEWENKGNKTSCFVRFNVLVTRCIKEKTFRQINYDQCMRYKSALSRWMHKRISHVFIQASMKETYKIGLFTIIRDSGMKRYKEIRNNIRDIKKALDEMVRMGVLSKYDADLKKDNRRIIDAMFTLYPGMDFIAEMKEANKISQIQLEVTRG